MKEAHLAWRFSSYEMESATRVQTVNEIELWSILSTVLFSTISDTRGQLLIEAHLAWQFLSSRQFYFKQFSLAYKKSSISNNSAKHNYVV